MYIGERGCQCPGCGKHHPQYLADDEGNEWYECDGCGQKGDKYDFTCTSVPDGYQMEEWELRASDRAAGK